MAHDMGVRRPAMTGTLLVLLIALIQCGCTTNRVASEITTGLEWAGLRSHADIDASNRWQLVPGARIAVEEAEAAADPVWIEAAREGIYRVFQPPGKPAEQGQPTTDLLLRVVWPVSGLAEAEGSAVSVRRQRTPGAPVHQHDR